ncbi:exodeoxyribonuclease 7 large subunit [Bacteroidia bacterium]|nr:exodeoxyribonuclease 7 large subunit [Bacteroidia bacterium]
MGEIMSERYISLFELNKQLGRIVKQNFADAVWVAAEIASIQENLSGHCYLELTDKSQDNEKTLAVAKATIWASTYGMLKTLFMSVTGREMEKGMKILVLVNVTFHEIYGFSLNIKDIDPTFTIGDLERKKREIIERLEKEGVIDMNRGLEFPLLPKRIAVISSPTAAGYEDFCSQLANNIYGYKFYVHLFEAVMQGEKMEESVITALDRIYKYESLFDVVVIIRGGGSQTELGAFDSYELATNVAQFPLPILSGIGHDRDQSIVDRVAHLSLKTPTAVAAYLVEYLHRLDLRLEELKKNVSTGVKEKMNHLHREQMLVALKFKNLLNTTLEVNRGQVNMLSHKIGSVFKGWLIHNRNALELAGTKIKYIDPVNVLERGYSITTSNGKVVKNSAELVEGDEIETTLFKGKVKSKVVQSPTSAVPAGLDRGVVACP